jgi:hypothetical protein
MLSKADILKPGNQKFGIGDLVYVCRERPKSMHHFHAFKVCTVWRICHSYNQEHGVPEDPLDNHEYAVKNPYTGAFTAKIEEYDER